MADQPYNAADLNSVLQALSGLAPKDSSSQPPVAKAPEKAAYVQPQPERTFTPQPRTSSSSSTAAVDPSTITTWPAALRYVMRTVGQNEDAQRHIRGLITSQHTHERKWWKGREVLIEKQNSRGDKQKQLNDCLRMVGAPVDETEAQTTQELQAELANYDLKIYQALERMVDALMRELRSHKIPFFVLKESLIEESSSSSWSGQKPAQDRSGEDGSTKLSRSELQNLQRRMLELLEDLCKE